MADTESVLDALRLRVTAAARQMLEQLTSGRGPLDLVHRCVGESSGAVAWVARGNARHGGLVPWADWCGITLYVRNSDVPALRDRQLVLEVAFRPEGYDSTEARLVTRCRRYTEGEQEMLDYAIRQRAGSETSGLLSRLSAAR